MDRQKCECGNEANGRYLYVIFSGVFRACKWKHQCAKCSHGFEEFEPYEKFTGEVRAEK